MWVVSILLLLRNLGANAKSKSLKMVYDPYQIETSATTPGNRTFVQPFKLILGRLYRVDQAF